MVQYLYQVESRLVATRTLLHSDEPAARVAGVYYVLGSHGKQLSTRGSIVLLSNKSDRFVRLVMYSDC